MLGNRLKELQQQADPPVYCCRQPVFGFGENKGCRYIDAIVKDGGIDRGLETVATENERVKKFGFTAPELERAKRR